MRAPALLLASSLLAGVALAGEEPGAREMPRPKVGEMHPDLRLPAIDGARTIRLSELRGKKLLLIEFASW